MSAPSRTVQWARAIHRFLLRGLPRDFRARFGPEMEGLFHELADDARQRRGRVAVLWLLVRTTLDHARTGLIRRGELRDRTAKSEPGGPGVAAMVASTVRDAAIGLRLLVRRPVFTAVAVATLALGIGANTAIFSVVHAVLIRPLPFPASHELVRLYHAHPESGDRTRPLSLVDREDWAEASRSLDHMAVFTTLPSGPLLTGAGEAKELRTAYVSAGFFGALGRDALLGRVLRDDEEHGDNRVLVLSHAFWHHRFGADSSIVGGTLSVDDEAYRVAGVMPPDFTFPSPDVEAWLFLTVIPPSSIPLQYRQVRFLEGVGRLADGVTPSSAEAELSTVAQALVQRFPEENDGLSAATVIPLRDHMTGEVSTSLLVLLGAAGLVLLIACGNVANLLLARGVERRRELDIRRAVGASRGRLVRQLLTESVLLSGGGAVLGVLLAWWGTRWLVTSSAGLLPRSGEVRIDAPVLVFSLALTVVTAIAFGMLPALDLTTQRGSQGGARGPRSARRTPGATQRWGLLTGTQVALATVLVISAGLLLRGLWALQNVDPGLDADRLLTIGMTINDARYPEREDYLAAYERLREGLGALPGVEHVASIRYLPLRRGGESRSFDIEGAPQTTGGERPQADLLQVSPGWFATAGVPLVAGREFSDADREGEPLVVVVNDALARRYFADVDPVGRHVSFDAETSLEVVGVVGDVHQTSLAEEPRPTLYVAQAQIARRGMTFMLRTSVDPATLVPAARGVIREVDADQPIDHIGPMAAVVQESTARPRFFAWLLIGFAAVAMLLAAFGIYGVVSNAVNRRVREIGVRLALGAPRTDVLRMVLRDGMVPVALGAGVGIAVALGTTRLLNAMLFQVSASDPLTFALVPAVLLLVAFTACLAPAMRAVRVQPTEALRAD